MAAEETGDHTKPDRKSESLGEWKLEYVCN